MPLTAEQLAALQYLEWFFDESDPNRRSGRTTAAAVALIRLACERPGQTILVMDHFPTREGREYVSEVIRAIVNTDPVIAPHIHWVRAPTAFRINLPRPIFRWLPPDNFLPGGLNSGGRAVAREARMRGEAAAQRLRSLGMDQGEQVQQLNGMALTTEESRQVRDSRRTQLLQELALTNRETDEYLRVMREHSMRVDPSFIATLQRVLELDATPADPTPPARSRLDILLEDDITLEP